MNGFAMASMTPKITGKLAGLVPQIFKQPNAQRVQTLFDAADLVTPRFRAACAGMDRMRTVMAARGVI